MEEFADTSEQKDRYFACVDDSYFWGDRERVKTLGPNWTLWKLPVPVGFSFARVQSCQQKETR